MKVKSDEEALELFRAAVREVDNKPIANITLDSELGELGLDSVATMEVVGVLEEKLDVQFKDEDLADLLSVGDLVRLVRKTVL